MTQSGGSREPNPRHFIAIVRQIIQKGRVQRGIKTSRRRPAIPRGPNSLTRLHRPGLADLIGRQGHIPQSGQGLAPADARPEAVPIADRLRAQSKQNFVAVNLINRPAQHGRGRWRTFGGEGRRMEVCRKLKIVDSRPQRAPVISASVPRPVLITRRRHHKAQSQSLLCETRAQLRDESAEVIADGIRQSPIIHENAVKAVVAGDRGNLRRMLAAPGRMTDNRLHRLDIDGARVIIIGDARHEEIGGISIGARRQTADEAALRRGSQPGWTDDGRQPRRFGREFLADVIGDGDDGRGRPGLKNGDGPRQKISDALRFVIRLGRGDETPLAAVPAIQGKNRRGRRIGRQVKRELKSVGRVAQSGDGIERALQRQIMGQMTLCQHPSVVGFDIGRRRLR